VNTTTVHAHSCQMTVPHGSQRTRCLIWILTFSGHAGELSRSGVVSPELHISGGRDGRCRREEFPARQEAHPPPKVQSFRVSPSGTWGLHHLWSLSKDQEEKEKDLDTDPGTEPPWKYNKHTPPYCISSVFFWTSILAWAWNLTPPKQLSASYLESINNSK
jgi:hypothetical protein